MFFDTTTVCLRLSVTGYHFFPEVLQIKEDLHFYSMVSNI